MQSILCNIWECGQLSRCSPNFRPIRRRSYKINVRCRSTNANSVSSYRVTATTLPVVPRNNDGNQLPARCNFCTSTQFCHQFDSHHANPNTTMDAEEIEKFRTLSQQFWDESGDFQALHSLNDLRVPLIRDSMVKQKGTSGQHSDARPLHGATIVDVGCGGGILAEPLARLGATVIGVDPTQENIEVAQHHLSHDPTIRGNVKYICGTAQDLAGTESEGFDGVVCSEVLEHVRHKEEFIRTCVQLAKPGGSVFFTTVNKTWLSYMLGIVMAERVLGLVPNGTHDWDKFVSPEFLKHTLQQNGCQVRLTHGMMYNPVTRLWCWGADTSINYALCAVRRDAPQEPTQDAVPSVKHDAGIDSSPNNSATGATGS